MPAFVETPELAVISDNDVSAAVNWVTTQLGNWMTTPKDPELHRQIAIASYSPADRGRRLAPREAARPGDEQAVTSELMELGQDGHQR